MEGVDEFPIFPGDRERIEASVVIRLDSFSSSDGLTNGQVFFSFVFAAGRERGKSEGGIEGEEGREERGGRGRRGREGGGEGDESIISSI